MDQQTDVVPSQRAPLDNSVYLIAALAVFVHFLCNSKYGYFRDELYYAACGEHLAWGYVDHAPLVALASRVSRGLFGDSLHAKSAGLALRNSSRGFWFSWRRFI